MLGFVAAAVVRGVLVGGIILAISRIFVPYDIAHPFLFIMAAVALAGIFGLIGLLAGVWGSRLDDVSMINNFLLTPLVYLGGIFFSVSMLPEAWRPLAAWNPIYYMVDLFRYSILGVSRESPEMALLAVTVTLAGGFVVVVGLIRRGWKIKP